MKKTYYIALAGLSLSSLLYTSCKKVLADKVPESTYTTTLLFSDSAVTVQYLNSIYSANLPSWGGNYGGTIGNSTSVGSLSEENSGSSPFTLGTVTTSTVTDIGTSSSATNFYGKIRDINNFISNLPASPIAAPIKNRFKAQALFWRAWRYFDLTRTYGGVPLVLTPQPVVGDAAKLADALPRNTTSQCFAQIVADLDTAIKYLPNNWPGVDYGRITRGAAQAFLGRVLLTWASPQFNVNNDQARWQAAYQASTDAITTLTASGYGLYPKWDVTMWTKEPSPSTSTAILTPANPEAVMVTEYNTTANDGINNDNNGYTQSGEPKSLGGNGANNPTWDEVAAFPMADGKNPHDPNGKYANSTTPWDSVHFYKNRDPRFGQTIAYNGCSWPLQGNANYRLWTYYYYTKGTTTNASTEGSGGTSTGFYCRKGIDPNISSANLPLSGTDWIEIRYAEVLLNQAEAAAMTGNSATAYADLIAIRKRAGIEAGTDGMYGLTVGQTGTALAMQVLYERQIELAYEGKRFWDLRRWKLMESVMNNSVKQRKGLTVLLKPIASGAGANTDYLAATRDNLVNTQGLDAVYDQYFTYAPMVVSTSSSKLGELKYLDSQPINWQSTYYFFGVPLSTLQSDPNFQQTNTWGGSFDPTK